MPARRWPNGRHDGFPAYELHVDDTPIYLFNPCPTASGGCNSPLAPCGRMDVAVSDSGTLP